MGLGSQTYHLSFDQIEKILQELLRDPKLKEQNSIEALSLIAQLPTLRRNNYTTFLDVDKRIDSSTGLGSMLNAYYRSLKKVVNLEGKDKTVIHGCSGADCSTVMLATDAKDFIFVDLTNVSLKEFEQALAMLKLKDSISKMQVNLRLENSNGYLSNKPRNGGSSSTYENGNHHMDSIALKLLFDLRETGVDLEKVVLIPTEDNKGLRINFPWQYQADSQARMRSITYINADITSPSSYPALLKTKIEDGFDIFYMKASFMAAQHYPGFLPHIAKAIKEGGWLMTADKTFRMEPVNPELCLSENNLTFALQKDEKVNTLVNLMIPPFDPLCSIPLLQMFPPKMRPNRTP